MQFQHSRQTLLALGMNVDCKYSLSLNSVENHAHVTNMVCWSEKRCMQMYRTQL